MSLYLCLFAGSREVDGVEVGPYADFNVLRGYVAEALEGGAAGSLYPTLMAHSDCDGEWPVKACAELRRELAAIIAAMKARPPPGFPSNWQEETARAAGLRPRNAFECFIDVDGEFLLQRLLDLADLALRRRLPILFQ